MKLNPQNNILKGESPQVGNPVQIKKLQYHERYEKEFYEDGIEIGHKKVTMDARVSIYFICAECGNNDVCIQFDMDNITDDEINLNTCDETGKCYFCNTEYRFVDGLIQVTKNPLHPEKLEKEGEEV